MPFFILSPQHHPSCAVSGLVLVCGAFCGQSQPRLPPSSKIEDVTGKAALWFVVVGLLFLHPCTHSRRKRREERANNTRLVVVSHIKGTTFQPYKARKWRKRKRKKRGFLIHLTTSSSPSSSGIESVGQRQKMFRHKTEKQTFLFFSFFSSLPLQKNFSVVSSRSK